MALSQSVHHFGPDWNISTNRWIATKADTDIHGTQMMNSNDFSNVQ